MALVNPTPFIQAAANAILASSVVGAQGITLASQLYYGAPGLIPSSATLPGAALQRVRTRGSRLGFNSGSGTTSYAGQIDVLFYLVPTLDIGTLDTFGEALIDSLIDQGGVNLNIIDVECEEAVLPRPGDIAGGDSGQPGMQSYAHCLMLAHLIWEG